MSRQTVQIDTEEPLTPSMNEYLVAIRQLIMAHQTARVKDIAALRKVKPGSVSPAMAKLAKRGLIVYARREQILLTATGAAIADKLDKNQRLLTKLFGEILGIPEPAAATQALCAVHAMTDHSATRLEELLSFLKTKGQVEILGTSAPDIRELDISQLLEGQEGTVRHIRAQGELNHQLIDMGLLPDSRIRLVAKTAERIPRYQVALQGFEVTLTAEQAKAVVVSL